jgi:hypothetical protein
MASPILQQLTDQVAATTTVDASAVQFINGIQALIDSAIAQALDNGATAEQLQPISDASNAMKTESDALAAAILAHTPQAPQ